MKEMLNDEVLKNVTGGIDKYEYMVAVGDFAFADADHHTIMMAASAINTNNGMDCIDVKNVNDLLGGLVHTDVGGICGGGSYLSIPVSIFVERYNKFGGKMQLIG